MLTPDFGTCQEGVLQRRKGFAFYDRWIWEDDRVPQSKILLTEGEEVDQIFWLRFGKSYRIFRNSFYSLEIESCFAMIGYDCVSVGYKYEPSDYWKD